MKNMGWRKTYVSRTISPDEIADKIPAGARVFVEPGVGEPTFLLSQVVPFAISKGLQFIFGWSYKDVPTLDDVVIPGCTYFYTGKAQRNAVRDGLITQIPAHFNEIPGYFRTGTVPLDVALIQVSPPDKHGRMNLGVSIDITRAAIAGAGIVIAQINQNVPRTHGDGFIGIEDVDWFVNQSEPILEVLASSPGHEIEKALGYYLRELIKDGDTINVGPGPVPPLIVRQCSGLRNIGIHSTIISNWLMELMNEGVITNALKNINPGKTVASMAAGTRQFYEFIDDNSYIELRSADYVNSPEVIASIRNFVSIHGAVKMDLSGNVSCDREDMGIGSGMGGITDAARNAMRSPGGRSIIVLSSLDGKGASNILNTLEGWPGIEMKRQDVDWVVTEYGFIPMRGRSIHQRALDLISLAHPDFRSELTGRAVNRKLFYHEINPTHTGHCQTSIIRDGYIVSRCRFSEADQLKRIYSSMSFSAKNSRFFGSDVSSEKHIKKLVSGENRHFLGVFERNNGEMISAGELTVAEKRGEIAVTVSEKYRRSGWGKRTLKELKLFAEDLGLNELSAEVLITNYQMIKLLRADIDSWSEKDLGSSINFQLMF
ncbi:hypothetical protein KKF34_06365 [Myxococcota bacterium]|nr:hypothetical protein [Myxococcota bacterium]MBU1379961.1 hypothetical protein [Myxococcota bacterium]MBU1496483.1 hypothetical protein [Myxococcota bacterium]